ncbi:MAG: DEAD/DEAH box helicase [Desulfobacteraceae bacterium]|nr:DEAD/DEAH box helicase [Desulfobacteraceae bacterium]
MKKYPRVNTTRKGTRKYHRGSKKSYPPQIKLKPGADARLKHAFSEIGVPQKTAFKPDPFQLEALEAIEASDCLVSAPTGAGKTWIAEQAIGRIFNAGGKAWYASPLKALTNAKLTEFSEAFGPENVGILTGDRKENPDAPIIVGTTEILRNQLYDAMHKGQSLNTDFVVLDEAHFLGDEERGVVWEEIMIYLPGRIPLLLLSATIGNARHIADWLTTLRGRYCKVVEEMVRPVPLYPILLHPTGTLLPLLADGKEKLYKKVAALIHGKHRVEIAPPGKLPPFGDILRILRKYRLLPALFFLKSRADCDISLQLCTQNQDTDNDRHAERNQRITALIGENPHISNHRQRWALEHLAVGSHHSGQLPAWKLVLETLMTEGLLDAVFATSTVAAGVNFPARTMVFLNSDRFNGTDFVPLDATQFHQMTGRAGRRGMDRIGFAMAIPGKFMDIKRVAKLFSTPPAHVVSKIHINFSMALNLLLSHTPNEIENLLRRSFATYLIAHTRKKSITRKQMGDIQYHLWDEFLRHLTFLKETGYVDEHDRLTDDGKWASQLRIDQPLMVAEALRFNLFPESDPELFAAVIAAFVNEKESDERIDRRVIPKPLVNAVLKVKKGLKGFSRHMNINGFPVRTLYVHPAAAMQAWAGGKEWDDVIRNAGTPEGDFSMLVMRTADNLRHIRSLSGVFPQVAATAQQAIERIMKPPVLPQL